MATISSKDLTACNNSIAKHQENIRKWHRMIEDAERGIDLQRNKLLKLEGRVYYVYVVFVDGDVKYIGKGKDSRYKHAVSGISSVAELNRDLVMGKCIEVRMWSCNQTEEEALVDEQELIHSMERWGLYNKDIPATKARQQLFWDLTSNMLYYKTSHKVCNWDKPVKPKYEEAYRQDQEEM